MGYNDMINGKKPEEMGEQLTHTIKRWDKEGDFLVGKLLKVDTFIGKKFDTECKTYLLDTDEGLQSTILGASSDKQLEEKDLIGDILYIRYQGQIELEGGKRCNRFQIINLSKSITFTDVFKEIK